MKAVIMAGGEGSRLRPLTLETPKPLARLCGKPVIEYILALLGRHGVSDCTVSAGYLQNELSAYLQSRAPDGMRIRMAGEDRPLGTAGGVKNAIGECSEDILVISGDALCECDLSAALKRHREAGAAATLIACRVEDPREYGLIQLGKDGLISGFIEKPPFSRATTDLANMGIYLLRPEVLERIPPDEKYDFAGDLFPELLAQKERLAVYISEGYWCDIGEISSYLKCQYDLLQGKTGLIDLPPQEEGCQLIGERPAGRYLLQGPVYIGKNVRIGDGARIQGPCVLDDAVTIGANAQLEGGILLPGAFVGGSARLQQTLICPGASVKWGATLHAGSAVGAHAIVGSSARVKPGIKIWPYCHLPDGAVLSHHLITQSGREGVFDDEGLVGEIGIELTPELMAQLGAAVGSLGLRRPAAIACSDTRPARVLLAALAAGIQSAGAQVMDFGAAYRALFYWSMNYTGCELGVYIDSGGRMGTVTLLGPHALGCPRETERQVEGLLARGEFARADPAHFGERIPMSGMQALYAANLLRQAPYGLEGMHARIQCHNRTIEILLGDTLQGLGCDTGAGPLFCLSPDGLQMRLEDEGAGMLTFDRLQCMLALCEFRRKKDISISQSAPQVIERLAAQHGRRVWRYDDCPAGRQNFLALRLAASQEYFRDALLMSLRLLAFCKENGVSLSELSQEIPDCEISQGELTGVHAPAALMERLSHQGTADGAGLLLQHRLGFARIRPSKRGDRIRVFAESRNAETAQELCADVLDYLRNLEEKPFSQ